MADFLTDIQTLRARARANIEQGPITSVHGADIAEPVAVENTRHNSKRQGHLALPGSVPGAESGRRHSLRKVNVVVARPETILAPLDGSDLAEAGVEYAAMVAEAFAARLVLFTAVGGEERRALAEYAAGEEIALDEAADAYLGRIARGLPETVEVERHHRLSSNPAGAIIEYAGEIDASMIVMASHGRSGVGRWLLGSVANKVVQSSAAPVLVVSVRDQ